jgi:guanine nucleotide-binding protein G(i) subunit alpha
MLAEKILDYQLEVLGSKDLYFSQEIADAIHQFHKDPAVQKIIDEHVSEFYLMDNAD